MTIINLKNFYPWYTHDEYIEVSEEVAEPETQGRRVDACVILGKSYSEVARAEGVHESAVRRSVDRGLKKMKQYLKKCL